MEHVTRVFDHDVIVVSVAYSQQIGGDAVASTGRSEVLNGLRIILGSGKKQFQIAQLLYNSSLYLQHYLMTQSVSYVHRTITEKGKIEILDKFLIK